MLRASKRKIYKKHIFFFKCKKVKSKLFKFQNVINNSSTSYKHSFTFNLLLSWSMRFFFYFMHGQHGS